MSHQGKGGLNPVLRRPPYSFHRSYNVKSYYDYTPQSVWGRYKPNIVVGGVIGLCCGTFYCQWTGENLAEKRNHVLSDLIRRNFISSAENIKEGRWWVLITSSFAHVDLPHLALNMLALWGFGRAFVGIFGVPNFVGLWVFSAASSSAAQIYWQVAQERLRRETVGRRWDKREDLKILGISISRERALAISGGSGASRLHYGGDAGASGVICGLTGVFLCLVPMMSSVYLVFSVPLLLGSLVFYTGSAFCMATGYFPMVGHAANFGGLDAGLAYYYGVARPWLRRTGRL